MSSNGPTFIERYHEHQRSFRDAQDEVVPSVIGAPETIDAWRHLRMYEPLLPILGSEQSWLTIGDSGADAYWLRSHGIKKIVASSITDSHLRSLLAHGYLEDITVKALNAERIDQTDESFDFLLCKEAFHHFARPMVGFYEMLRVARQGVVLLAEPNGDGRTKLLDFAKSRIKRALRKGTELANEEFEYSGNFIYGLSLDEIYKAATALQYRHLYYLNLNDFFISALARKPISNALARRVTRLAITVQDFAAHLRLMSWGSTTILLLKEPPSAKLARSLEVTGFRKRRIPLNPYL